MSAKDQDILEAWGEFVVSHALASRAISEQIAGKAPLTLDEYDVLLVISRSPAQRMRFAALADATVYTRSGITRIAKRLEESAYLTREGCPEDKRGFFAVLTEQGKKALRDTWRWYGAAVLQLFGSVFSHNEARTLRDLLAQLSHELRSEVLVQIERRKPNSAKTQH